METEKKIEKLNGEEINEPNPPPSYSVATSPYYPANGEAAGANFDESKGSPLLYPAPNSPVIVVYQQPNQAYQQTVYVHQMPPDYLGK
jgi:hypothetical protein